MTQSNDTPSIPEQDIATIQQENVQQRHHIQELQGQVKSLEKQIAWFKNQIFGPTSEKRLFQTSEQADLLAGLATDKPTLEAPTETITYERKKGKKNRGEAINDTGLRFDESVEVKEIRLAVPELDGPDADNYIVIDEHITCRLAQRRSSYIVLKYIQPVIKHKLSSDPGV